MRRTGLFVFVLVVIAAGVASATTNVDIQPTGARHGVLPGLAMRGRLERRTWDLDLKTISPAHAALSCSLDDMSFEADMNSLGTELLLTLGSRIELRAVFALADIEISGAGGGSRFNLDTDLGVMCGFGARFRLPASLLPGWDLEVDFELLRGSFDGPEFFFTGGEPLASATDLELDWRQIAVSPTISRRLGFLTPYAGLRFSTADADLQARVGRRVEEISFENDALLSVLVGARFRLGTFVNGDVHVDLLNNEGVVASVSIRF